jgi:MFS transporter, NNP family, nitrate/nitrite transporter
MGETFKPGAARALFFSTTAFAVSFAVWGLISALAPTFTQIYKLSATSKSLLIAIPVLLGSVGRLPAGMLADRFGGCSPTVSAGGEYSPRCSCSRPSRP